MNIVQSKEKLKKDGYTWFDLIEFDTEFYNKLMPIMCNDEKNIKKYFTYFRADVNSPNDGGAIVRYQTQFETFEKAEEKKKEVIQLIKNINTAADAESIISGGAHNRKLKPAQMWYYSDSHIPFKLMNIGEKEFINYIKKIMMYFYDFDESQEYSLLQFPTYYDDGCVLQNHSDGTGTGRICALLIYLNETYDEKDGGILVLNDNEKVIPTFGKVAIIDLQSFDIPHMVTEVTGGTGRYAILSFVKRKEDELVHG